MTIEKAFEQVREPQVLTSEERKELQSLFDSINPLEELGKIEEYLFSDYFSFRIAGSMDKLKLWLFLNRSGI